LCGVGKVAEAVGPVSWEISGKGQTFLGFLERAAFSKAE